LHWSERRAAGLRSGAGRLLGGCAAHELDSADQRRGDVSYADTKVRVSGIHIAGASGQQIDGAGREGEEITANAPEKVLSIAVRLALVTFPELSLITMPVLRLENRLFSMNSVWPASAEQMPVVPSENVEMRTARFAPVPLANMPIGAPEMPTSSTKTLWLDPTTIAMPPLMVAWLICELLAVLQPQVVFPNPLSWVLR
jgi:hypothetical protein